MPKPLELKSTRAEQMISMAKQMAPSADHTGSKIPTVEQMSTRVELMELRSTLAELMVQETNKMAQARQMSTNMELMREVTIKADQAELEQRALRG